VVEQEIHITLRFTLATGRVGLNEIVYRLKEVRDPLMVEILEQVLRSYDDLIVERLRHTEIYPSKARKGLGRHVRKDDPEGRFCRGRKVKGGLPGEGRKIMTVLCRPSDPDGECCRWGPHLCDALKIGSYVQGDQL
jgi:hypothetical protein